MTGKGRPESRLPGVHDAQEVENFLWHLENYFKCNRVRSDVNKINTVVLYLSEMPMLWWRRKEFDIKKGTCTMNTWEQFCEEFKKAFSLTTSFMRQSASLGS